MSNNPVLILKKYFSTILNLNKELHNQETLIEFYKIKCNNLNIINEKKKKEIEEKENQLTEIFITMVENENFFITASEIELKDIIEKAKEKKKNYNKKKEDYIKSKKILEQTKNDLNLKIKDLSAKQLESFNLIKDIILNNINLEDEDNEIIQKYDKKLIKQNKKLIKDLKEKCLEYKENIDYLKNEIDKQNQKKKLNDSRKKRRNLSNKKTLSIYKNSYFNENNEIFNDYSHLRNLYKSKNSSLSTIPINNNLSSFLEPNHNPNLSYNIQTSSHYMNTTNDSINNLKYLNKTFYLLRHKRIEDDLKYSLNMSTDQILEGNLCKKLLKNYKKDFRLIKSLNPEKNKYKFKKSHSMESNFNYKLIKNKNSEIFIDDKYIKQNSINLGNDLIF